MGIKIIMRSLGVYFWIPILINDIIIPLFVLLIKINGTEENVTQGVMILSQMFTPFLSAFWTYMYLEKYIDMKGNECFYIVRKNKWPEIMWLLFLYVVTNTIPNTGITLPFISYGGTSVVFLLAEIGLILNVSRHMKKEH